MKKLTLFIAIVFSGMLMQAQIQKTINWDEQLVYVNEDSYSLRDIIDTLNINDTVTILKTSDSKHLVTYIDENDNLMEGWVANFAFTKKPPTKKLDWSIDNNIDKNYKGELVDEFRAEGYVSRTYLKGNTYRTYVNGKLDHTYTSYH